MIRELLFLKMCSCLSNGNQLFRVPNSERNGLHPSRYRQIVETQSLDALNDKEHRLLCEDQKHSSVVAKVHYCCKGPRMPSKITGDQRLKGGYGSEH